MIINQLFTNEKMDYQEFTIEKSNVENIPVLDTDLDTFNISGPGN